MVNVAALAACILMAPRFMHIFFFFGCHSRIVDCKNKIIPLTIDAISKQSLTIGTIKIDATAAAAVAAMGAEQKIGGSIVFFFSFLLSMPLLVSSFAESLWAEIH